MMSRALVLGLGVVIRVSAMYAIVQMPGARGVSSPRALVRALHRGSMRALQFERAVFQCNASDPACVLRHASASLGKRNHGLLPVQAALEAMADGYAANGTAVRPTSWQQYFAQLARRAQGAREAQQ